MLFRSQVMNNTRDSQRSRRGDGATIAGTMLLPLTTDRTELLRFVSPRHDLMWHERIRGLDRKHPVSPCDLAVYKKGSIGV